MPIVPVVSATVDALPIAALKQRALQARRVLRNARRGLASVGGLVQLDAALDATAALLPGLLDRSGRGQAPLATVRRLRRGDRLALKAAMRTRGPIPRALERELADVAPRAILEAIERVELCDEIAVEVMALLRALEVGCKAAS